ncbi:MAG: formamidopyrimidine-DNA glycosylase [Methyloligella sp.]|nr:MAG: formamidopyrimidine-DNA glycosylase [Methyloligella sp.]
MPELPEVETVMRGLSPHMTGAKLVKIEQNRENLRFPFPKDFVKRLTDVKVEYLSRRAKYVLVHLSSKDILMMHLGMSGKFTVNGDVSLGENNVNPKHDHIVFHLSNGDVIRYNDPRRFGYMDLVEEVDLQNHKSFIDLGPEPLGNEFSEVTLAEKAVIKDKNGKVKQAKKTPIKTFLLDQRVVAGLGNIYVLEALYKVKINPKQPVSILVTKAGKPTKKATELTKAIRQVLQDAIKAGGSTLKDYAKADGSLGYFQHSFQVYGREGEACLAKGCKGTIERIVQSGRSSFFCPNCQKI